MNIDIARVLHVSRAAPPVCVNIEDCVFKQPKTYPWYCAVVCQCFESLKWEGSANILVQ